MMIMIANDDCQLKHQNRPVRQTYYPSVGPHIVGEKLVYIPRVIILFMSWCA